MIVGGLAVQTHGHVRTTVDIDVLARPEPGDLSLAVAGRDDLIAMKRANGRRIDLEDIAALTGSEER